jgi:outer membrane protein TolC
MMNFVEFSPKRAGPVSLIAVALAASWVSPLGGQEAEPQGKLTLASAVAHALEHHPAAVAADAGVAVATAAVGEISALRLPQVRFEASATRYQEPMIVAPLHALDITRAPDFDRTLLRGTASVAYTLFDGGVRGSRVQGARAELDAAESMRESAQASLIAMVTQTYLQVLTAGDVLAAHDTRLSALAAERDRTGKLFAEGTAARVAVLRAEAAIAQAQAERVATAAALEVAEQNLARQTGVGPDEAAAERLVPIQLQHETMAINRDALLEQATTSNPELQRAREKREVALSSKRAAAAMWLPNISLFGGYLGFGSGGGDLVTEWQGGAKVSYPIFTGGARSKASARAGALVELARQDMRQIEITVQNGVDRGLSAVRESRARFEAVEQAVTHLTEVARIESLALETGAGTQTEYLRSEAELLRAKATLIDARNTEIAARVELARIVGQLNPTWIDRELENTP